jgi:GNAT superfamily N-acetyltransferase
MKNYLKDPYFLVIEEGEDVFGFIYGEPLVGDGVIIWYLVIHEDKRGNGLGSELLKEYENRCKNNGVKWSVLYTPVEGKALNFYKRLGYKVGVSQTEMIKILS